MTPSASPIAIDPDFAALRRGCAQLSGTEVDDLNELLALHGIASEYIEYSGKVAQIPLADRVDILELKGVRLFVGERLDHAALSAQSLALTQDPWRSLLPPVAVLSPGGRETVDLHFSETDLEMRWQWTIDCEDGRRLTQDFLPQDLSEIASLRLNNQRYSRRQLAFAPLRDGSMPCGYHRLTLSRVAAPGAALADSLAHPRSAIPLPTIPLIIAPARCHEPAWVKGGQRLWGFSVQLYGLRSPRNWGIGDLGDLQELIHLAAQQGASFLVLNPLHALDLQHPDNCSPYSPNDRRRLNPLYIDPTQEVDYRDAVALCDRAETERLQAPH